MKAPSWLISGALLFWGWQTGLWFWGFIMAAVIGGARWVRSRWEFSDTDLNRISDLCWVLFLGAGLLLYSTEDRLVFIFKFAQWLPFTFFPIMLAQTYGNRPEMALSVFSWLLRRAPQSPLARKSFNISYPYFAICVMGASASTRANDYFYVGIAALVLLGLTSARPQRTSWAVWIILAMFVTGAGYASQKQLRQLQNTMEGALGGWLADFFRAPQDSRECRTLIGHTGRISLSGRIAMRVRVPPGDVAPQLLREAAYDTYKNETWWASSNDLGSLCAAGSNDVVKLLPPKPVFSEVEIARFYDDSGGDLALPQGTFEIDNLPALVRTNRLGLAEMESGPGFVNLLARYGRGESMESPPNSQDLGIPENELPALTEVADELHLFTMRAPRQKVRAVERFFATRFTYSLRGRPRSHPMTPLGWFLTKSRSGHCEYFATATVLLLREAGIPARYITGYAVLDTARHGDTYLIRDRHAHAWALAYNRDAHIWEQIDTTPANWDQADEARPPWWESATDFFSDVYFQFSKWRWGKTSVARYVDWLLVPLILYLLGRILMTQRRQRPVPEAEGDKEPEWPGLDSELYLINQRLAAVHLGRLPNEPLHHWEQRLEHAFPNSLELRRIFHLHRRLRFDPEGLEILDRQVLRREANAWLDQYGASPAQGMERQGVKAETTRAMPGVHLQK